jgi:hypothetical protein
MKKIYILFQVKEERISRKERSHHKKFDSLPMGSSVEENDENFFGSLELVETVVFRRSRDRKAWRERVFAGARRW